MFRTKDKKTNQYGSFRVPDNRFLKSKTAKISAAVLLCAAIVGGLVFALNSKPKELGLSIPEAEASDLLPGWWYDQYFDTSVCDVDWCKADSDPDSDKLTNAQEFYYHSDPLNEDTNGNGATDGKDVSHNVDPSKPGNISFDQQLSDDEVYGESVLFAEDIKKEYSQSLDISAVQLPLVTDSELVIIKDVNQQALKNYSGQINDASKKYFPENKLQEMLVAIQSGHDYLLGELDNSSLGMSKELRKLPVPTQLVNYHKYLIAFYDLLPRVLTAPSGEVLADTYSVESNRWYDDSRAFMVIMQKMDLEARILSRK